MKEIIVHGFAQLLSYFPSNLSRITKTLTVSLSDDLSYLQNLEFFAFKFFELFSKQPKKSLFSWLIKIHLTFWGEWRASQRETKSDGGD